jgi:hypothetical protein
VGLSQNTIIAIAVGVSVPVVVLAVVITVVVVLCRRRFVARTPLSLCVLVLSVLTLCVCRCSADKGREAYRTWCGVCCVGTRRSIVSRTAVRRRAKAPARLRSAQSAEIVFSCCCWNVHVYE